MPNIASRFPKEFHWNKTFLMDKAVPPTEVSDLPNRSRKKKTFFPKFIEKNSLQDRHTCLWNDFCVSGSKDSRFVHLFKHPFEQLMFEVV